MREIKFRAWDKYFKKIVEVRSISFKLKTIKVIPVKSIDKLDIYETTLDDIEVMQYTGLKDIYGVEIYEGDIIKETLPDEEAYTFIVEWNKISAGFVLREIETIDYYGRFNNECDSSDFIIIGNIYENKE